MKIFLSGRQLRFLLYVLIVSNLLLLLGTGTYFFFEGHIHNPIVNFLLMQSNLAWENTGAAWYSSMLLLMVAVVSALCFIQDKYSKDCAPKGMLSYGWVFFTLIFLTLSLDEIGSLHENVDQIPFFQAIGFGGGLRSNVLYSVIILVGLFMVAFFWVNFKENKLALLFVILGTLFYLSNPIQERIEVAEMMAAPDYNTWKRPVYYFILEEGSEIFGTLFFLIAVVTYTVQNSAINHGKRRQNLFIQANIPKKVLSTYFIAFIVLLTTLFLVTKVDSDSLVERGDNGIPQNWFPSSLAFLTSLISFHNCLHVPQKKQRAIFWILGLFCLFMSFYFGSDMFDRVLEKNGISRSLVLATLSLTCFAIGTALIRISKTKWMKLVTVVWTILLIIAITGTLYSTAMAYGAFMLLFLAFCYKQTTELPHIDTMGNKPPVVS